MIAVVRLYKFVTLFPSSHHQQVNPHPVLRPGDEVGKMPRIALRQLDALRTSSASGSSGALLRPSIATALWRAHSLLVGFDGGWTAGVRHAAAVAVVFDRRRAGAGVVISVIGRSLLDGTGAELILLPTPPLKDEKASENVRRLRTRPMFSRPIGSLTTLLLSSSSS